MSEKPNTKEVRKQANEMWGLASGKLIVWG
jgi:hypothetical protein